MVVAVPGATSPRRSRCPARAQALNLEVESTGLAALREWGSFHHLPGSIFCGARAKCALGDFGCDLFHSLRGCLGGDAVTHDARTALRPPKIRIRAQANQRTQGNDEEPLLAPDCCWLRGSTVVPLGL